MGGSLFRGFICGVGWDKRECTNYVFHNVSLPLLFISAPLISEWCDLAVVQNVLSEPHLFADSAKYQNQVKR